MLFIVFIAWVLVVGFLGVFGVFKQVSPTLDDVLFHTYVPVVLLLGAAWVLAA